MRCVGEEEDLTEAGDKLSRRLFFFFSFSRNPPSLSSFSFSDGHTSISLKNRQQRKRGLIGLLTSHSHIGAADTIYVCRSEGELNSTLIYICDWRQRVLPEARFFLLFFLNGVQFFWISIRVKRRGDFFPLCDSHI